MRGVYTTDLVVHITNPIHSMQVCKTSKLEIYETEIGNTPLRHLVRDFFGSEWPVHNVRSALIKTSVILVRNEDSNLQDSYFLRRSHRVGSLEHKSQQVNIDIDTLFKN